MSKKTIVIGSGFSGLAAAACLAKHGHEVIILEKNSSPGGRARQFASDGFTFDMGPSWYWMPKVFEDYFARFGKKVSDFYELQRLSPSYRVFFDLINAVDIPSNENELFALFEKEEKGSSEKLKKFLKDAKYKYDVGMSEFVWKPSHSILEYMDPRIAMSGIRLNLFSSISSEIRKLFKSERLIKLLEFPVLFLGAKPQKTPALYSLMNYADLSLGTWYPKGGMYEIVKAMLAIAEEQGVQIKYNSPVHGVKTESNRVTGVYVDEEFFAADFVVSSADYAHTDRVILGEKYSNYSASYWDKRLMAPSSLLFYLGIEKKITGLKHHNLFFDESFDVHAQDIYDSPRYPDSPLFYACLPSKTDPSVAPEGNENMFLLLPLAAGLEDSSAKREQYFDYMINKLEIVSKEKIKNHILYKRSYAMSDFVSDYNAFKGNAYGLANTLMQTAFLKPKLKNKKLKNFFYTGQLTTPGPGVPPSIISGQVVAKEIIKLS